MSKKKTQEYKTTLAEAFIQFQIQVKRKEIEFTNETSELEAENQKLTKLKWPNQECDERLYAQVKDSWTQEGPTQMTKVPMFHGHQHQASNQRNQLREEQLAHIRTVCKQAKEQERKLKQREVVKEQVEQAQQHNLKLIHSQEKELAELRRQLEGLKVQLADRQKEQQVWLHYKNVGNTEHQQQIQVLQSELTALQNSFEMTSENIKRSLDLTFNEIDKKTSQLIDEKKKLATKRAIEQLDKSSCREIKENDWLKRELATYSKEVSILDTAVRKLEQENLKHTKQLFDYRLNRLNDLQISRNVFLTQDVGSEQMDSSTLEHCVQRLSLTGTAAEPGGPLPPPDIRAEVGGAQQQTVEKLEKDETGPSCKPFSPPHDLPMLPYGSQNNLSETIHLGPLEQKLLTVVGQAMTLHPFPSDPEDFASDLKGLDWSLNTSIDNKFK